MITQDTIGKLNLAPGDQLEIEWVDARYLSGWHDRQEILSWERDFNKHHSTGFFVFANDDNLLFAETWSSPGWEHKSTGGINSIPLNAILHIWRLQRVEVFEAEFKTDIASAEFVQPFSRTDARPLLDNPSNDEIAKLATDWRLAERSYQDALTGNDLSASADIALAQLAGAASQALRTALDNRLNAEAIRA